VAFFGPDGAGKSTHARLLLSFYLARGRKARKVWIRANHSLAYLLSKFLLRLGYSAPARIAHNGIRIAMESGGAFRISTFPRLRPIWPWIEFISLAPLVLAKVSLPLLFGCSVIAERYVIDSAVTIAYTVGDDRIYGTPVGRALLKLLPKDAFLIYLRADSETLRARRMDDARGIEFLEYQLQWYDYWAARLDCPTIRTDGRSIGEVQALIRDHLRGLGAGGIA